LRQRRRRVRVDYGLRDERDEFERACDYRALDVFESVEREHNLSLPRAKLFGQQRRVLGFERRDFGDERGADSDSHAYPDSVVEFHRFAGDFRAVDFERFEQRDDDRRNNHEQHGESSVERNRLRRELRVDYHEFVSVYARGWFDCGGELFSEFDGRFGEHLLGDADLHHH
jgi:hypothetical protein